jgi:hypothetical protein
MENFTADEILKLEKFKLLFKAAELSIEQIEGILDRKIVQNSEKDKDPIVEHAEIKSKPQ